MERVCLIIYVQGYFGYRCHYSHYSPVLVYKFAVILKLILHYYHIFPVKDGCCPQEHMHDIEKANGIKYLYTSFNRHPDVCVIVLNFSCDYLKSER